MATTVRIIFFALLLLHPLSSTIAILLVSCHPPPLLPLSSSFLHRVHVIFLLSSPLTLSSLSSIFPPSFSFTILPLILLWPPPPFYPITLSSSVSPPSLTILSFSHLLPMQTGPPGQIQPELWSASLAPPPWCPVGRGTYCHTRPPGSWHDYQWCVSQTSSSVRCVICIFLLSSDETQSLVEMLEQLSDHSTEIQNWTCGGSVSHLRLLPALSPGSFHGERGWFWVQCYFASSLIPRLSPQQMNEKAWE